MLTSALKKEEKDYLVALSKSVKIIQKLINKNLYSLLNGKNAKEIQAILEICFYHIILMYITQIFLDTCAIKFSDCKDTINYDSCYQIIFDKIISLTTKKSLMLYKIVEISLQESFFQYLGKNYSTFILAIKTKQKKYITNFSNTILKIIRHFKINKGNIQNLIEGIKILLTRV